MEKMTPLSKRQLDDGRWEVSRRNLNGVWVTMPGSYSETALAEWETLDGAKWATVARKLPKLMAM